MDMMEFPRTTMVPISVASLVLLISRVSVRTETKMRARLTSIEKTILTLQNNVYKLVESAQDAHNLALSIETHSEALVKQAFLK